MAFTNFETSFLEVSVTIWHLSTSYRERVIKKTKKKQKKTQVQLWKNSGTSLASAVTTIFPSKTVNDLTEIIIESHGRLINVRRFAIVQ